MKLMSCQIDAQGVRSRDQMDQHQKRIEAVIENQLGSEKADLILLPELSSMEYSVEAFENLQELAIDLERSSCPGNVIICETYRFCHQLRDPAN